MTDPNATNSDADINTDPADTATGEPAEMPGYALVSVLGAGACGVVYRARQHALQRDVALKTIEVDGAIPQQVLARFEKEAQALARLKHPNIVQVYEFGRRGQRVFLAMELLDGEDLDRRIQNSGPMDERTAWPIARQAAAALAHAAAAGVFHRDVKPANLFLVPPPTGSVLPPGVPMVKVTDFGLALTRDSTEGTDQRLTRPGVTLGTPVYMAPEQFASPDVDHRADIYALGVTVCQMLSGHTPFDGATVWEVMKRKAQPPELPSRSSPGTKALLADMLAADAGERISSYDELLARIDDVLASGGSQPSVASQLSPAWSSRQGADAPPSPNRFTRRALLIALAGGVAGGAVIATHRPRGRTARPEELFDGKSLAGWATAEGGEWAMDTDAEGVPVLAGTGPIIRRVVGGRAFRVLVALDLHTAAAVELRLGPAAVAVTRSGANGVPYPDRAGKSLYVEVKFERSGGKWAIFFDGRPVGETPDDGDRGPFELIVSPADGAVRIEAARAEPVG